MTSSFLLFVGAALFGQVSEDEIYRWPLDLPRILTSSFAEYRPGRFHMGIDLRTGPIGKDVFAIEDGYVSRVRSSPYGYGKAIYLSLRDGRTVVYGHLNDYEPALRAYVRAAQHRSEDYTVDLYPEPGEFPVTRGQLIAKSGMTGIGVPHLHFEIRDRSGAPVSPRRLGMEWPDTTAPVFRKVLVTPLDGDASINGDLMPVVLDVVRRGPGRYTAEPIRARGWIGFGADLVDPANGGATRLGVHIVDTVAGGEPLFRIAHERVSYAYQNDGAVAYHPYYLDQGRFLVQWRWPGNRTAMYGLAEEDGRFFVPETGADIEMTATDFHGNGALLTIPVAYDVPAETLPSGAQSSGTQASGTQASSLGTVAIHTFGQHLVVTARFTGAEARVPRLEYGAGHSNGFQRVSERVYRAAYTADSSSAFVDIRVVHPQLAGDSQRVHVFRRGAPSRSIEEDGLRVTFGSESVYGTQFVQLRSAVSEDTDALKVVGSGFELWPSAAPIDEAIDLSVAIGATSSEHLRIYRYGPKRWRVLDTRREGGRLVASTRGFGRFAVFEDVVAPVVNRVRPARGATVATRRPAITALIDDAGSGIDDYRVTCNGKWLLVEYDPEEKRLAWARDEDIAVGINELVFDIWDYAGNRVREKVTFTVVP